MKRVNKGIVLPYILWSVLVLTILTLIVNLKLNSSIDILKLKKDEADKEFIASNLISISMGLLHNDNTESDSFLDPHICMNNDLDLIPTNYSITYKIDQNSEKYLNGLYPCNSLLNINHLNNEVKNNLIESSEFTDSQWAALFDWVDPDNDPYNNGDGVENEYYESLDVPYKAKNGTIENWEELYLIKDMDDEFFNYLKNNFTIYGNGKININTVSINTLLALGISEVLAEKLVAFLSGYDEQRATEDDMIIEDINRFPQLLTEESLFSAYEISELTKYLNMFTIRSEFYQANIYFKKGLIARAVIKRDEEQSIVLYTFVDL